MEIRKKKIKREISAGLIVFRKTKVGVKFILLYHGRNYWNFPKGHIESEEKSLPAAIRETTEETGLTRGDLRIIKGFKSIDRYFFRNQKERIFKIVIFYLAETKKRDVRISEEHAGFAWFLYPEAMKLITKRYRGTRRLLREANDFISKPENINDEER